MTTYPHEFYAQRHRKTRHAAEVILGLVRKEVGAIQSAVDVGCGVGTWLSVIRDMGVEDIQGYDGPWVEQDLLAIPRDRFQSVELSKGIPPMVTRQYDLAISLEVAEHLTDAQAPRFVGLLTGLSDTVLFSAAIPGQGGTGHVNEQWPEYWAALFRAYGYGAMDCLRTKIWDDAQIPFWYRQNCLILRRSAPYMTPRSLVHPELFQAYAQPGVKGAFTGLMRAVKTYMEHRG